MTPGAPHGGVVHVSMLAVLFEDFQAWLASRELRVVQLPDAEPGTYIVIPTDDLYRRAAPDVRTDH